MLMFVRTLDKQCLRANPTKSHLERMHGTHNHSWHTCREILQGDRPEAVLEGCCALHLRMGTAAALVWLRHSAVPPLCVLLPSALLLRMQEQCRTVTISSPQLCSGLLEAAVDCDSAFAKCKCQPGVMSSFLYSTGCSGRELVAADRRLSGSSCSAAGVSICSVTGSRLRRVSVLGLRCIWLPTPLASGVSSCGCGGVDCCFDSRRLSRGRRRLVMLPSARRQCSPDRYPGCLSGSGSSCCCAAGLTASAAAVPAELAEYSRCGVISTADAACGQGHC